MISRMSQKAQRINTLIFGGGVAGLWLLNKVKKQNASVLLLENNALGAGQTIYSQGIIHSGVKYALTGKLTKSSQAIKSMPHIWKACLDGQGEIDLSGVSVLSASQFMWSEGSLGADLTTFFASKSLASRVKKLEAHQLPKIFSHKNFHGGVYELNEPVLDAESLLAQLAKNNEQHIVYYDSSDVEFFSSGIMLKNNNIKIEANNIIFLAGEGNQALVNQFNLHKKPKMQLRPLQMSYVKTKLGANTHQLPKLYAHCMQSGAKPRITISSYQLQSQQMVWYLGGDLAETGVKRSRQEQNAFVKQELVRLFPCWCFNFDELEIDSFLVQRAEAKQCFGKRPDMPAVFQEKNIITAWPTKLAFAPLLVEMIIEKIVNKQADSVTTLDLPRTNIIMAKPKWDV